MGEGDTNRRDEGKPRVGIASPEHGNANEIIYTAPGSTEGLGADLTHLYTISCSMRNKQDELKALVCSPSGDIICISETWWNESHNWSAGMEGYRLFKRGSQGRRGRGAALYVTERFDCTAFTVEDDMVESLWVRIRGMENKADVVAGVYYQSSSQDDSTDGLFCRQLGAILASAALVLLGDSNFPDISWEFHTAVTSKSGKFFKSMEDNFLSQVPSEPTRRDALLDLFVNREGLMGDVMVGGCLGHSDHEILAFKIFGVMRKKGRQSCHSGFPGGKL